MNTNTILITGAASGIGLAAAKHFHSLGYVVGMADINLDSLSQVTQQWDNTRLRLFQLDVCDVAQVQQVVMTFCAEHNNSLTVLLNNAGILEIGPFETVSIEQHQRTLNINVNGVMNLCHAAWPYLKNHGNSTVINMSSASSDYGVPELASYSASKFAVKALTEALELEWNKYGISVCDVMPPFVATNMLKSQQNSAKVLHRLGVNITAQDVVAVIDKQIRHPKTHRTVSLFYGILHRLSNVSPAFINRLVMKWLSR
ncbi:SDR family oxidoreductase [Shewanella algicola]|uniref:SDR family oxidoreductase n=1 Tax=Shewanella algicola TaxID=640633 RepID=UPI002493EC75|nr:SDR family oxidoreductase [Shewanella algicola]